jgi:PAS domain S-box-containing protein
MADNPSDTNPLSQLEQAALRLAAIVDSSEDAIVAKTLDGIITAWNRAAERMFGYTAAEAVGRPITIIIPPERIDEEVEVLSRLRRGESIGHFETVRRHKSGAAVEISLSVSPIRTPGGQVIGASKIARDITERRRSEAERASLLAREQVARQQAEQANRIKDEFLAILSHELRTPLQAMLGWVSMLRQRRVDQAGADRAVDTIERNTRALARLVDDILDVSRITMGSLRLDLRPVELVPVIEAAVESFRPAARAKDIEVSLFLDPAVGPVGGDGARLQQVVSNLISNAVKFTPRGGRVEVRLDQDGSEAEIRVSDTGRGIAPEFLPRIFDRFTQEDEGSRRRYPGLGLGLAIVRHLVELHGGTVTAASRGEGHGAAFIMRVPLLRGHVAGERWRPGAGPSGAVPLDGLRVLVVDDEKDARDVLAAVLEAAGATVAAASSGSGALALLDQERFDVALCDIAMPDLDGYDVVREVKRRRTPGRDVPVAALTAYANDHDRQRALAAGFEAHIAKPVEPDRLVREVARLAGRRPG